MCTVLFIPDGRSSILVSLRDEDPLRPLALKPTMQKANNIKFCSPKDGLAGGTWIGVNEGGHAFVLLNGGFEKHLRKSSYRRSRGLIVRDLLTSLDPMALWTSVDLTEIEPFTLVAFIDHSLHQWVWDGMTKHHVIKKTNRAHIWSSSTLYNNETRLERELRFDEWIHEQTEFNWPSIISFFQSFDDKQNGFFMNRADLVRTISMTFIEMNESITFAYSDSIDTDPLKFDHLIFDQAFRPIENEG